METDPCAIRYRQQVMQDALNQPKFIQSLYVIASEMEQEAQAYREQMRPSYGGSVSVRSRIKASLDILEVIFSKLIDLRKLGAHYHSQLRSKGFQTLFKRVEEKYSDIFLRQATEHVNRLKRANVENRLTIDVKVGDGLKGTKAVLRERETDRSPSLLERMLKSTTVSSSEFNFSEIQESALTNVLKILKQFIDRMLQFFDLLRFESGFYVGSVHLHEELTKRGCDICFPEPLSIEERSLRFKRLVDPSLAIVSKRQPVGNDLRAEGTLRFVITGANQGGKTCFLRSVGLAQLMMQCGLFVPASFYEANVCDRIFTHFSEEEDQSMV